MYKHGDAAMKARVQKWGNSLGFRIPKILAQEVALETDSEVDLSTQDGTIVISPVM
jgi:antitoxin MazE